MLHVILGYVITYLFGFFCALLTVAAIRRRHKL